MTTAAASDRHKDHAAAQPPTIRWCFGNPPRGAATPPSLVFTIEAGGRVDAAAVFRRPAGQAPVASLPDRTPALLELARPAAFAALDCSAAERLAAERRKLREVIELCATRAADVERRRKDPALLAAPDFGEQIKQINQEAEVIAARKTEAEAAVERLDVQLGHFRQRAEAEFRQAVVAAANQELDALDAKRNRIMARIADTAAPLLEELYALDAADRRPPDPARVVALLLSEKGLSEPVTPRVNGKAPVTLTP